MIQHPYILQYNFKKKGYLTFEPLTLMPIQLKMVDPSLLNQKEVCMVDFHFVCTHFIYCAILSTISSPYAFYENTYLKQMDNFEKNIEDI